MLLARRVPPEDARQIIYAASGKRYDPLVVVAFRALFEGDAAPPAADLALLSYQLRPGMVLSRDLLARDGVMLLSAEHVLNAGLIRQVQDFETTCASRLAIRVWPPKAS